MIATRFSFLLIVLLTLMLAPSQTAAQSDGATPTPFEPILIQSNPNLGFVQPFAHSAVALRTGLIDWQDAGLTGVGIRVGVLDRGFGGLLGFQSTFDTNVSIALGADVADYDQNPIRHGTQVLEIVHTIAPDSDLFTCAYASLDEYILCIDWFIRAQVQIVVHSAGVPALPLDGSSRWSQQVERATDAGVLWVNAAGNFARGFFRDVYTDTNANVLHEFRGAVGQIEALGVDISGQSADGVIMLSWSGDEERPANSIDLDLHVLDANSGQIIAESLRPQAGFPGDEALEYLRIPFNREIGIQISNPKLDAGGVEFALFVEFASLPGGEMQRSIIAPADAEGSLTVGALQGFEIAPYSSRGPLSNGTIKPDLVAPGEIRLNDGTEFIGTSAAAPVVAGAAALIWQANPSYNADDVREQVLEWTSSMNGTNVNSGRGRLIMPLLDQTTATTPAATQGITPTPQPTQAPPTATIAPSPTPEPLRQARVFVTDEGLKLRVGPGSDFPVVENMPAGTIVTYKGTTSRADGYIWHNITTQSGNTGWAVEAADSIQTLIDLPPAQPQPTRAAVICTITNEGSDITQRAGPGTYFAHSGLLPDGQNAADAQARDTAGFTWWRLTSGFWVRSDVVAELGNCDALPGS